MKYIGKLSTNNQNSELFISILERFLLENADEYIGVLIGELEYIHSRAECYEGIKLESLSKVSEGSINLNTVMIGLFITYVLIWTNRIALRTQLLLT